MPALEAVEAMRDEDAARAAAAGDAGKDAYVRGMFDAIAPRYDFLNRVLSFSLDRRWRRRAVAALDVPRKPAGWYLDLCAGTLDLAMAITDIPGFSGQVVGADFSEPMLRAGSAKVRRPGIVAVAADALTLPLPDASCAGAIVGFGIRNVADLDGALAETRRVLEPGARFVILEFSTPHNRAFRALYDAYSRVVLPRIGAFVSGHRTAYSYLPDSIAHFPAAEPLAARLRAAGFREVHWEPLMFGAVAIHRAEK